MNQINCPRCSSSMKTIEMDGVAVETCNTCGGIYLDKGELDAVSRDTEGSVEFCTATDKALATDDGRDLIRCPKCSHDAFMEKVEFNGVTSIVLDRCLGCEGYRLIEKCLNRLVSSQRESYLLSHSKKN